MQIYTLLSRFMNAGHHAGWPLTIMQVYPLLRCKLNSHQHAVRPLKICELISQIINSEYFLVSRLKSHHHADWPLTVIQANSNVYHVGSWNNQTFTVMCTVEFSKLTLRIHQEIVADTTLGRNFHFKRFSHSPRLLKLLVLKNGSPVENVGHPKLKIARRLAHNISFSLMPLINCQI